MATQSTRFGTLRIVREQDLPLFCPRENDPLWARHPRVYLKPDSEGRARFKLAFPKDDKDKEKEV